jgi:transposase-like protein
VKTRWSRSKKRDVVLRILRGEPIDVLSRELGVEVYRLEAWRDRALAGMESGLREREVDGGQAELEAAMKRIGELSMENELLRERCRRNSPFGSRTSGR